MGTDEIRERNHPHGQPDASSFSLFHANMVKISIAKGRSAYGACAYAAGSVSFDDKTGLQFDYQRKVRPISVGYVGTEAKTAHDFAYLLESRENRKNSVVARELVVALPASVSADIRLKITCEITAWISNEYDIPVMYAIHKPDRRGNQDNYHFHLIAGTRDSNGKKLRILDDLKKGPVEVRKIRAHISQFICDNLPSNERSKWSHLSLAARGINRPATKHEGPMITSMRRKGISPNLLVAVHNNQIRTLLEIAESEDIENNAKTNITFKLQNKVALNKQQPKHIHYVHQERRREHGI